MRKKEPNSHARAAATLRGACPHAAPEGRANMPRPPPAEVRFCPISSKIRPFCPTFAPYLGTFATCGAAHPMTGHPPAVPGGTVPRADAGGHRPPSFRMPPNERGRRPTIHRRARRSSCKDRPTIRPPGMTGTRHPLRITLLY